MDQIFFLHKIITLTFFIFKLNPVNSEVSSEEEFHWGYSKDNGPHFWHGTCQTGRRQSPINIVTSNLVEESFPPLYFNKHYEETMNFETTNNGHSLAVFPQNRTMLPTFQGAGLDGKYILQHLHFHWKSEHLIDGERSALEMHMVHYNSKYKDIGIASLEDDGIAVMSVLCDESEESDSEIEHFLQQALRIEPKTLDDHSEEHASVLENPLSGEIESVSLLKLRNLLPENFKQWYRYDGSLTTPGCDEIVTWIIFTDRISVSSDSLSLLRKLRDKDDNELINNYRPVQNLNDRKVFLQVDEDTNEVNPYKNGNNNLNLAHPCSVILSFIFILYTLFKNLTLYKIKFSS